MRTSVLENTPIVNAQILKIGDTVQNNIEYEQFALLSDSRRRQSGLSIQSHQSSIDRKKISDQKQSPVRRQSSLKEVTTYQKSKPRRATAEDTNSMEVTKQFNIAANSFESMRDTQVSLQSLQDIQDVSEIEISPVMYPKQGTLALSHKRLNQSNQKLYASTRNLVSSPSGLIGPRSLQNLSKSVLDLQNNDILGNTFKENLNFLKLSSKSLQKSSILAKDISFYSSKSEAILVPCHILEIRGTYCIIALSFFSYLPIKIPNAAEFIRPLSSTHEFYKSIDDPDTATFIDTDPQLFEFYVESLSEFHLLSKLKQKNLNSESIETESPRKSLFLQKTARPSNINIIPQHILILREEIIVYPYSVALPTTKIIESSAEQRALRQICFDRLLSLRNMDVPFLGLDTFVSFSSSKEWMYRAHDERDSKIIS